MFGMSGIEFWEEEPQLYWAYQFSFVKKQEIERKIESEKLKQQCWLQGKLNEVAFEIALKNAFSKTPTQFPKYEEVFESNKVKNEKIYNDLKEQLKGVTDENLRQQIEFNYWARI